MKKVVIFGLHLGYGGVEQAIVNLANMLCNDFHVELVITYKVTENCVWDLDKKVNLIYLTDLKPNKDELKKALKKLNLLKIFKEGIKSLNILWKRTNEVKKYIKRTNADILISSRILYTKLIGKYGKKDVIKIAQEHRHHNNDKKYIDRLKKACVGIDYLVPVSKELTDFYQKILPIKCVFIPNSLEYWPINSSDLSNRCAISVGRLSKEKGYLDLIDVFKLVHQKHSDWKLDIIGDGEEKELIKQKIKQYKLEQAIILHGFQKKQYIYEKLKESSIYLMCSYEESFGIVLIEAGSFGIPSVAFDSAQGANEIIENNKTGFLIKNRSKEEMANKIIELIENENLRHKFGTKFKKDVYKYSFENVKKEWLKFLKEEMR